ncbi:MAG: 2TM domain-containing protein [Actinomycetia bacterium]|nr:2TM domain-containing protein [Actinomycetes bacterium]
MTDDKDLRKQAASRLKQQQAFKVMLGGFVILWIICIAIWALGGDDRGHFWPIWVIFGTGIAAAFTGWNAYGPRSSGVTDADIDQEVRKMKGQ